jgi:hypothetical protein
MGIQYFAEHTKGTFGHRIEQDTQCLFSGNRCVRATIAFAKAASAIFAFVALFSENNATFDQTTPATLLAR